MRLLSLTEGIIGPLLPLLAAAPPDLEFEAEALRLTPAAHPVHGTALNIPVDIRSWPGHWQRAVGLRPQH